METKEWLESLKPGDEVAVNGSHGNLSIRLVARLTKTQIILNTGNKFRRDSGYCVGGSAWGHSNITQVTEKVKHQIKIRNIKYKISMIDFNKLPVSKMVRILAIVNEAENGQAE